jgi:hypothetical protein
LICSPSVLLFVLQSVDTTSASVVFPSKLVFPSSAEFTNELTASIYFMCSQPNCAFQCKLYYLGSRLRNGSHIVSSQSQQQSSVYTPCAMTNVSFTITLVESVFGSLADANYIQTQLAQLKAQITSRIASGYTLIGAQVSIDLVCIILLCAINLSQMKYRFVLILRFSTNRFCIQPKR